MPKIIPAETRIQQINALPNIQFVRWEGVYQNSYSRAICRCDLDGFEWAARVTSLVNCGHGCPQCSRRRGAGCSLPAEERISQINAKPNITFIRWDSVYINHRSKAICRCDIDGFTWTAGINSLINCGTGCPQCAGKRIWTVDERVAQINDLPNISFVRWDGCYKNQKSKAICRCNIDGFEWSASVRNLVNGGHGCPACAQGGFNPTKQGTLYILRSDCGSMVKIGISNDHEKRHRDLKRATPFDWSCIELLHGDGEAIADMEKELHSITEQAIFRETFDGYTEWRKWDPRLLKWIKRYRTRLERRYGR